MPTFWIQLPEHAPRELSQTHPTLTMGRAPDNDLIVEDRSISRNHARLNWKEGQLYLEDLGSRNGTLVNGMRISGTQRVAPGDKVVLGSVPLTLHGEGAGQVQVEAAVPASMVSVMRRVDQLRPSGYRVEEANSATLRWKDLLATVHEVSLDLIGDKPLEVMLDHLLEHLFRVLKPDRGAVLLRREGRLEMASERTVRGKGNLIRLSSTMVEAAVERREAMLVNNPLLDPKLGQAQSLVQSGAVTIMTVPLEHEDEVVGLIYLDAGFQRNPFTEDDLTVVATMGHLAAAKIRQMRMALDVAKKRDLDRELAVARQIQERLLPVVMPALPGYEIHGVNLSCKQISGDLFGFWPRPDGQLWVVIADVAGKGVGPGLLMATFQAYMHAWSEGDMDSAQLASRISASLAQRTTPNRFITAFLMLLNPATGALEATNAGHNPVLLLRDDGRSALLEAKGFPLSMFPGTPYGREEGVLAPGDLLVLCTDGILEATDAQDEEFGWERLEAVVRAHRKEPLEALATRVWEALDGHTGGSPLSDDRTLVLVRRSPTASSAPASSGP